MKLVKESINFERGINPKDAMGIGMQYKQQLIKKMQKAYDGGFSIQNEETWGFTPKLWHATLKKILYPTTKIEVTDEYIFINAPAFTYRHIKLITNALNWCVPDKWNVKGVEWNCIPKHAKITLAGQARQDESINFERGLNPKDAMNVGNIPARLKKIILTAVEKLSKEYDIKDISDEVIYPRPDPKIMIHFKYKNIRYFIMHYGKNSGDLEKQFLVGFWFTQGSNMNWFTDEESHTIIDCTETLKLWFDNDNNLKESRFERGLNPKDAMNVGDVLFRKREIIKKELKKAIKILVYDLNAKKESVVENFSDVSNATDIQFGGKYKNDNGKLRDCLYFIGYNFKIDINPYYAGIEIYNDQGKPVDSAISHYDTMGECMNRIRVWAGEKLNMYEHHFERGLDPKQAMHIGKNAQDEAFKKFLEKELAWNDARVTINDDGTFTYCCLPGKSMYREIKNTALQFGWDVKVKTMDGGSRLHDDGSIEHEYLISHKKTKKKLTETQHFQRGLDPKRAMDIGLIKTITLPTNIDLDDNDETKIGSIKDYPDNNFFLDFMKKNHIKYKVIDSNVPLIAYTGLKNDIVNFLKTCYSIEEKDIAFYLNESNFQRGLDPKRAMDVGIFKNLKPMMNGVIANEIESEAAFGYINYIETAEWRDQVDENTGEVGWPYIHIEAELRKDFIRQYPRPRKVKEIVQKELEYIFKKIGIAGKVEISSSNYEYHFYPKNNN